MSYLKRAFLPRFKYNIQCDIWFKFIFALNLHYLRDYCIESVYNFLNRRLDLNATLNLNNAKTAERNVNFYDIFEMRKKVFF